MNPAKLLAITRAFLSQRALMNYLSREGGVRPRPFFSLLRGEIDIRHARVPGRSWRDFPPVRI